MNLVYYERFHGNVKDAKNRLIFCPSLSYDFLKIFICRDLSVNTLRIFQIAILKIHKRFIHLDSLKFGLLLPCIEFFA